MDNNIYFADPHAHTAMFYRLDIRRTDYLYQAEELTHFAQSFESESGAVGCEVAAANFDAY